MPVDCAYAIGNKLAAAAHAGLVADGAARRGSLDARVGPGWRVHPGATQLPPGAGVRTLPSAEP
jgi:hypothetical protein